MARKKSRKPRGPAAPPPDFTAAPWNPRRISKRALDGLRSALRTFGDLSGFVMNEKTGHVICGHQRRQALPEVDIASVGWGPARKVQLGRPSKHFTSPEREGYLTAPSGSRFHCRLVRWPVTFERAANVAANSPALQGEFTRALGPLLEEVAAAEPDLAAALLFNDLLADFAAGASADLKEIEIRPPPPMTWILVGIPTVRFGEIATAVEGLAARDDVVLEISTSDAGADLVPSPDGKGTDRAEG